MIMAKITREKILATAETLITANQQPAVTLDQIAQQLDVTHAAIYKHFTNKQALWEAVAAAWFQRTIIDQIPLPTTGTPAEQLHDWLWAFANAKKHAYNDHPQMFALNTRYIDSNPTALRAVLTSAYVVIDTIMDYDDAHHERAETILSAFSVFALPTFKDTWNDDDYAARFEALWHLIVRGL